MANVKTSAETVADPLSGSELVRIVQDGENRKATADQFAALGTSHTPVTIAYASSITINLSSYPYSPFIFDITLTGDLTLNLSNGFDGQVMKGRLRQDGTGGHLLTFGANIRLSADIPSVVLSTGASKLDYIGFEWCSANGKADVLAVNKGF